MNAASYARGAGWLTPQIDWYGVTPRTGVLEFPLYSIVAYLLSRVSPSLLIGARVASLAFSVAAIVVFDRVCALRGHPRRRAATALFALAPVAVFYGHSTQPEFTSPTAGHVHRLQRLACQERIDSVVLGRCSQPGCRHCHQADGPPRAGAPAAVPRHPPPQLKADPFWWWWLAGGLLSIEVFSKLNQVHFYYQLPLVPALAALAADAVPAWPRHPSIGFGMAATALVATLVPLQGLFAENPLDYHAGRALAAATPPGQPVLVLTNNPAWFPSVLYYAHRTGWNLGLAADDPSISALPGPAVCDMVVVRDGPVPDHLPREWSVTADTPEYLLAHRSGKAGCGAIARSGASAAPYDEMSMIVAEPSLP